MPRIGAGATVGSVGVPGGDQQAIVEALGAIHEHCDRMAKVLDGLDALCRVAAVSGGPDAVDDHSDSALLLAHVTELLRVRDSELHVLAGGLQAQYIPRHGVER